MFAKEKVEVPDVVGMLESDATSVLEDAGFIVGKVNDKEATEEYPEPGTVLASKPEAGEMLAKGAKVDLDVVIDPSKVRADVPKVVGMSEAEATTALQEAGFVVVTETTMSEKYNEGVVAEQNPAAGTPSYRESVVTIRVSTGPSASVSVPEVVGLAQGGAEELLKNVGLKFSVSKSTSDSVPAGTVMSSSPSAGSKVKPQTNVALIVSSGPAAGAKVTIPDYAGWNSVDAQNSLAGLGLTGKLNPAGENGEVLSTSPAAGASVNKGSSVTINVKTE
jgi:serine/threonine-protein kinase